MTTFEFKPDWTHDDFTDDLNFWLNDPSKDGTSYARNELVLPVFAVLPCAGQITVERRKSQVVRFQGTVIRDTSPLGLRGDRHLVWHGVEDYEVRSPIVQGDADPIGGYLGQYEAQHAFEFIGCRNTHLHNPRTYDVWGDKLYFGPDSAGQWCDGIEVSGLLGGYSHRHGIAITGARNVSIHDSDFGRCGRAFIDFEANSAKGGAEHVRIDRVNVGLHRLRWIACGASAGTYTDIEVTNSRCYGSNIASTIGRATGSSAVLRDWRIEGNVGETDPGGSGCVFACTGVDGITVVGNENPFNPARVKFASFTNCSNIDYHDNQPADPVT